MNPEPGFWQAQYDILTFHEKIGDGPKVHPYCSQWYSWILMWRPVAYFYQTARDTVEQVPAYPPLPNGSFKYVYDVHAMGNPFLWWLSTAAIVWLLVLLIKRLVEGMGWKIAPTPSTWIALYFVFGWLANLLPWVRVTRCTFLYHYGGFGIFWLGTRLVSRSLAAQFQDSLSQCEYHYYFFSCFGVSFLVTYLLGTSPTRSKLSSPDVVPFLDLMPLWLNFNKPLQALQSAERRRKEGENRYAQYVDFST